MSVSAVQPVQQAYSINCFINTANPGQAGSDGNYDFNSFLYTMEGSSGAWAPDPDVTGSGNGLKLTIPNNLNGEAFYFTIADYGNNSGVLLKSVTISWNSGPWLFNTGGTSTPLAYTNANGLAGASTPMSINNPQGPAVFWYSPITTNYVNGINQYKGQTMSFTVQVTVSVPNGTPTPAIMTFKSDPDMEVDPNT